MKDKCNRPDGLEKYRNKGDDLPFIRKTGSDLRYLTLPYELSIGLCLKDDEMDGTTILSWSVKRIPFWNALAVS